MYYSMSFTRAVYDKCAYAETIQQSVGPGLYMLTRHADEPCFQKAAEFGVAAGGARAETKTLVDIDSELMGITRQRRKCAQPVAELQQCNVIGADCTLDMITESSRISNPPHTLRENGVNRFVPLLFDPQRNLEHPFYKQVNNRLLVKDSHRPCVTAPADASRLLPPEPMRPDPVYRGEVPAEIAGVHDWTPSVLPCDPRHLEKL